MTHLQALLLGVVQGLTEFLPVSSSGHLVLGKQVLGVPTELPVTFEVVAHLGTLLATVIVFWKPIVEILDFLLRFFGLKSMSGPVAGEPNPDGDAKPHGRLRLLWVDPSGRMVTLVVLGTIPAVFVGVQFESQIETLFENALLVGMALVLTGCLLFATRWSRPRADGIENVSAGKGLLIGLVQAAAITPGISRSGATIATALFGGVDRETAARFSFLLSIPAIAGAATLKARDIAGAGKEAGWLPLVVGFASSLIVGYIALRLLLAFVRHGRLHWFAYYCWLVGLAAIVAVQCGWLHS